MMNTARRTVVVVACAFLLAGCAARINRAMSSWQGRHYHQLIAAWGPPQQVFDDGADGRILIWSGYREIFPERTTGRVNATQSDDRIWGSVSTTREPAVGYRTYRMFWVNRSGFIYRWSWRGF